MQWRGKMCLWQVIKYASSSCYWKYPAQPAWQMNAYLTRKIRDWPESDPNLFRSSVQLRSPSHPVIALSKSEDPWCWMLTIPTPWKHTAWLGQLLGCDSALTGRCGASQIMLSCQACNEEIQTNRTSSGKLAPPWWTSFRGDNMHLIKCRL